MAVFPPSESKGKKHHRVLFLNDAALAIVKRRCEQYPTGMLFRNSCGNAWTKAGPIWYETLLKLSARSEFQEAAETTVLVAGSRYDAATAKVVRDAWAAVGIKVSA